MCLLLHIITTVITSLLHLNNTTMIIMMTLITESYFDFPFLGSSKNLHPLVHHKSCSSCYCIISIDLFKLLLYYIYLSIYIIRHKNCALPSYDRYIHTSRFGDGLSLSANATLIFLPLCGGPDPPIDCWWLYCALCAAVR